MRILPTIEAGTVEAVITDPPYGIAYRSKTGATVANDDAPFIWWLREAHRITIEGGALLCFCRWDVQESFRLAIVSAGYKIRSQVVWDRVHQSGSGDCLAGFAPRHDIVWFATKGRGFAFPGKRPHSVLAEPSVNWRQRVHPTEKPTRLMRRLVEATTRPGGMVVDPFCGSGSTGVACAESGRRFLGIELDPSHASVARGRLRAVRTR